MINPAERSLAAIVVNVGFLQTIDTRDGAIENDQIFNSVVIIASRISALKIT
ncbi:hypothetical protein [Gimesia aquarii]|uniref:hypothetical protein n=1 Tax=Gimesia aquarii TaxID=2527964 RepID=UPI0018D6526C|nr:hypothetical protein [Gimesia aquarii]